MTSAREHDIILRRLVTQFRRLARRVSGDPSTLVPRDPAAALLALGVPVEALLLLEPLDRLRGELPAAPPDDAAAAPLDGSVRSVATANRRAPAARSAPMATTPHRPALIRNDVARGIPENEGAPSAAPSPAANAAPSPAALPPRARQSVASEASAPPAPRAKAVATLAERRAAARRGAGVARERAPASKHPLPAAPGSRSPAPRASEPNAPDARPLELASEPRVASQGVRAVSAAAPSEPRAGRPAELPIRAHRAGTPRVSVAAPPSTPDRAPGLPDRVPARGAPREALRQALGTPVPASSPSDVSAPGSGPSGAVNRALAPHEARARSSERGAAAPDGVRGRPEDAACELADELFEALYRGGVDLAWP